LYHNNCLWVKAKDEQSEVIPFGRQNTYSDHNTRGKCYPTAILKGTKFPLVCIGANDCNPCYHTLSIWQASGQVIKSLNPEMFKSTRYSHGYTSQTSSVNMNLTQHQYTAVARYPSLTA